MPYKLFLITVGFLSAIQATAQDTWRPMTQGEAESWLYGQLLWYESGASQSFDTPAEQGAQADTEYVDGRPSQGRYTLIQAQYCSVWPPSPTWDCYRLEISPDARQIRFIGLEQGDIYTAQKTRFSLSQGQRP